jgi:amino acid transporter
VLLQVAFIGALKSGLIDKGWANLAFTNDFGPLAAVATLLGLGWLAVLLYADAIISPGDTGLIYTTISSRISYAMARNGNAPASLSKTTDRGVPLISLVLAFVVGLIVFLPFPSWQQLVGFITSATVLSFASGPLVLSALRKQVPDAERPFRLPGGHVIPVLAFWCSNLIVYWSGWLVNWKLFVAVLIGFVLLAVFHATGRVTAPKLDFKAGAAWLLPWLGGLALISYLGSFPDKSDGAGNRGLFSFEFSIPLVLVFSIIVYAIALRTALSPEEAEEHIARSRKEAQVEEETLGAAGH